MERQDELLKIYPHALATNMFCLATSLLSETHVIRNNDAMVRAERRYEMAKENCATVHCKLLTTFKTNSKCNCIVASRWEVPRDRADF